MRKGSTVVNAILGIVLILLLSGVVTHGYDWAKKVFFSEKKLDLDEFVPYQPELTSEEMTVENSIQGLILAINAVASGTYTQFDEVTQAYEKQKNAEYRISSYVLKYKVAFNEELEGRLDIGSGDDRIAWVDKKVEPALPASSLLIPMNVNANDGKSRYARIESSPLVLGMQLDVWYESAPSNGMIQPNPDGSGYCTTAFSLGPYNKEGLKAWSGDQDDAEACKATATKLTKCPGIEALYCGWYLNRQGRDLDLYFDSQGNARAIIKTRVHMQDSLQSRENSGQAGVASGLRPLTAGNSGILFSGIKAQAFGNTQVRCTSASCEVKNFILPQDTSGSFFNPADWITAARDPNYLVYYESFPQGEEGPWQISEWSFFNDVLVAGAFLNGAFTVAGPLVSKSFSAMKSTTRSLFRGKAVPDLSETLEKGIGDITHRYGTHLSQKTIRELSDYYTKKGYERYIKSAVLYDNLLEEVGEDTALRIQAEALRRMNFYERRYGEGLTRKLASGKFGHEQLADDIIKRNGLTEPASSAVRRELKDISTLTVSEDLARSYSNRQALKRFFGEHLLDDSGRISPELYSSVLTKRTSGEFFQTLPKEAQEEVRKKAALYADELFDAEKCEISWHKILGTYEKEKYSISSIESLWTNTYGKFSDDTIESLKVLALGNRPYEWPIRYKTTIYGHISSGKLAKILYVPDVMLSSTAKSLGIATKDAYNLIVRSRLGRYTAAFSIGHILAEADAGNEKFKAKGENVLIINQPYLFERNAIYPLSSQSRNSYITLWKENEAYSRFYLASPCKADIIVEKSKQSCELSSGDYIVDGFIVEKNSVQAGNDALRPVYSINLPSAMAKLRELKKISGMDIPAETNGFVKQITARKKGFREFQGTGYVISDAVPLESMDQDQRRKLLESTINANSNTQLHRQFMQSLLLDEEAFGKINADMAIYIDAVMKYTDYEKKINRMYPDFTAALDRQNPIPQAENYFLYTTLLSFSSMQSGLGSGSLSFPGLGALLNEYARGDRSDKEAIPKFIEGQMLESISRDDSDKNRAQVFLAALYRISKENPSLFRQTFSVEDDGSAYSAVADAFQSYRTSNYYYIVDTLKADATKAVRKCTKESLSKSTDGLLDPEKATKIPGRVQIDSIRINPYPDPRYNDGQNYCYSGDHYLLEAAQYLTTASAIAIDVGVAMTGVGVFAESPVAMATGAGAAWFNNYIGDQAKWPNYQRIEKQRYSYTPPEILYTHPSWEGIGI